MPKPKKTAPPAPEAAARNSRADAQRNQQTLLRSALEVFMAQGVDAPVRAIAEKAGVGIGTIYRHFPQRADLIAAVYRNEIDACAESAATLAQQHPPAEALREWMQRYASFVGTKRGFGPALRSEHAALGSLREYFFERVRPELRKLLAAASAAGATRPDIDADDLLVAVASLCHSPHHSSPEYASRMVGVLTDGLMTAKGSVKRK